MIGAQKFHFDNCKIAVALRAGRAAVGWSQQEFAEKMGVAKSTVARIETLEMTPKSDFVMRAISLFREAGLEVDVHSSNGIPIKIGPAVIQSALEELSRQE
jgi:transcriptional regulator with XRE-family HTH domain